ncbi:hypothetical protein TWF102_006975 [Orbilia oligospora]|uniref:Uncharacterized protein n=1 Tax=Orbilia oligospora TaxID=2813651 RepID=A0A7C8NVP1_ORBOL|nr:hypothetical protein TWF103_005849 [Orbilia oligospora]KAF3111302.1 hypothetical protein TWF102_006975 [Orbilia oligospora]
MSTTSYRSRAGTPDSDQTRVETGTPDSDQTRVETGAPDSDQTRVETDTIEQWARAGISLRMAFSLEERNETYLEAILQEIKKMQDDMEKQERTVNRYFISIGFGVSTGLLIQFFILFLLVLVDNESRTKLKSNPGKIRYILEPIYTPEE